MQLSSFKICSHSCSQLSVIWPMVYTKYLAVSRDILEIALMCLSYDK